MYALYHNITFCQLLIIFDFPHSRFDLFPLLDYTEFQCYIKIFRLGYDLRYAQKTA